jgi:hypothetical protein
MACKYASGMVFVNDEGLRLEVLRVRSSIHGNTSHVTIRVTGSGKWDGERNTPTRYVTRMIRGQRLYRLLASQMEKKG